ncbi:hypothetical protein AWB75_03867 [Caballeronia catudaia]|uniref:Uncharacterized protein n=1 Tax=Caballeronia catudaia TaxID=1777136 RepID=A0A158BQI2_9BURK|nr:hypothetical protein AWB75_03867 [Caballeronia catudaia]
MPRLMGLARRRRVRRAGGQQEPRYGRHAAAHNFAAKQKSESFDFSVRMKKRKKDGHDAEVGATLLNRWLLKSGESEAPESTFELLPERGPGFPCFAACSPTRTTRATGWKSNAFLSKTARVYCGSFVIDRPHPFPMRGRRQNAVNYCQPVVAAAARLATPVSGPQAPAVSRGSNRRLRLGARSVQRLQ